MAEIDLDVIRLIVDERMRNHTEYTHGYDDADVRSGIQTLADALAAALERIIVLEGGRDDAAAGEAAEETSEREEPAESEEAEGEETPGEAAPVVDVLEDGEPLVGMDPVELTPAEALDDIQPLRTHRLLMPISRWFGGDR